MSTVAEMRRGMLETVATMRVELGRVELLDEEGYDALVRLRLHLTWLQGQFSALRVLETKEAVAMRRSLLRAGDRSLELELGEVRA